MDHLRQRQSFSAVLLLFLFSSVKIDFSIIAVLEFKIIMTLHYFVF